MLGISLLVAASASYLLLVMQQRDALRKDLAVEVTEFWQQQELLLNKLSGELQDALQQHELLRIKYLLSVYEDIMFGLSQRNLQVPLTACLVSLNAPQQIVCGSGLSDSYRLNRDDEYYLRMIKNPGQITLSEVYFDENMPDYYFINWSVAIVDDAGKYLAHIEVKAAHEELCKYLQARINDYRFEVYPATQLAVGFDLRLRTQGLLWNALLYIVYFVGAVGVLCAISWCAYRNLRYQQRLTRQHDELTQKLAQVQTKLHWYQQWHVVQQRYGELSACANNVIQEILLSELLQDILVVNQELALIRRIEVLLPEVSQKAIYVIAERLWLMRLLSGVLQEILCQSPSGSVITINFRLEAQVDGPLAQQFVFSDNAFYTQLVDRQVIPNAYEIRCQSWLKLLELVRIHSGTISHEHTAYVGNTITIAIPKFIKRNVVPISQALIKEEA